MNLVLPFSQCKCDIADKAWPFTIAYGITYSSKYIGKKIKSCFIKVKYNDFKTSSEHASKFAKTEQKRERERESNEI